MKEFKLLFLNGINQSNEAVLKKKKNSDAFFKVWYNCALKWQCLLVANKMIPMPKGTYLPPVTLIAAVVTLIMATSAMLILSF